MCFAGLLVRVTGDTIAMSPPLIVERQHIEQLIDGLSHAIKENSSSM
jgi:beta-alanine--pyruvate transaminase